MLISQNLNCFLTIVKEGSIKKAASNLFLSTAPISRRVKLLEQQLGFNLFIRGQNELILTEKGRKFYDEVISYCENFKNIEKSYSLQTKEKKIKKLNIVMTGFFPSSVIKINEILGKDCILYFDFIKKSHPLDKLLTKDVDLLVTDKILEHDKICRSVIFKRDIIMLQSKKLNEVKSNHLFAIDIKNINKDNLILIHNHINNNYKNPSFIMVDDLIEYKSHLINGDLIGVCVEDLKCSFKHDFNIKKISESVSVYVYYEMVHHDEIGRKIKEISNELQSMKC